MPSSRDFRPIGEFPVDAIGYAERHGVHPDVLSQQLEAFRIDPDRMMRADDSIFGLRLGRLVPPGGAEEWLLAIDVDDVYLHQLLCVAILQCRMEEVRAQISRPELMRRINMAIREIIRSSRLVQGA